MATISSSTTTAFDVTTLVSQLMAVERKPVDTLNTKISDTQARISSWGTLSGLVSSFQSSTQKLMTDLQKLAATSSDTTALSASAASTGVPGTYSVNVTQLAQSQSLVAAGQTSSSTAISDGTPTTLTFDFGAITGGTLTNGTYGGATFTSNGNGTTSIVIDGTNNTLEGIRDAINAANMGVSATIVNDGSGTPYRLALSAVNSGADQSMKISVSGGDGTLDALLGYDPETTQNLTQTRAAQNATLTVNGIDITSPSNTVSEAVQGVTLTLRNLTSTPANITIERDVTSIDAAVNSFVDSYNALATQMKSRLAYGSSTATAGALSGDSTLRSLQEELRSVFNTATGGGTLSRLAEVGISFQKDGTLAYDSSKLTTAIGNNFSDVLNLFNGSTGFATRIDAWASSALQTGGLIDLRTQTLKSQVQDNQDEIDRLEIRLSAIEKKYTREYTNLNLLLSSMNTTSTFLTQQLLTQTKTQ